MTASLDGIGIRVASLGEIIASKRHADRAKDREALPELEQLELDESDRTEEGP